jgi:drug/metabolite transporter (DMT)-like permease
LVAPLVLSGAHARTPLGAWLAQASGPGLHDEQMMIQVQTIVRAAPLGEGDGGPHADAASVSGDRPGGGQEERQWDIRCWVGRSLKTASLDQPQMLERLVLDADGWSPLDCAPQQFGKQVMISNSAVSPPMSSINGLSQMLPIVVVLAMGFGKVREAIVQNTNGFPLLGILEYIAALALFCISGPTVILLNRHIMQDYGFRFPILLASLGNVVLMVVSRATVAFGWKKLETEHLDWNRYFRVVVPINVLNFLSQTTGMYSFLFISIPLIQTLKSLVIVVVLGFSWLLVEERVNTLLVCSVLVITFGACQSAIFSGFTGAGAGGTGGFIAGMALILSSSTFEALKTISCQMLMDRMSVFDGIYHSSPCFVLIAVVLVGCVEAKGLAGFSYSGAVVGLLAAQAATTGLVVLSSFWLVKLAGALVVKVVTQARSVGLVLGSVLLFGESCTTPEYIGFTITLIGTGMFDSAKQSLAKG